MLFQESAHQHMDAQKTRLFEYFFKIEAESGSDSAEGLKTSITQRLPLEQHDDCGFPEIVWMFCFPAGIKSSETSHPPMHHTFVLTSMDRIYLYGTVLVFYEIDKNSAVSSSKDKVYLPKAIGLLSSFPIYNIMLEILRKIFFRANPLADSQLLSLFAHDTFDEQPSRVEVLIDDSYFVSTLDTVNYIPHFPWAQLFQSLSLTKLCNVLSHVLVERKVIFTSSQLALTSLIPEMIKRLILPFQWSHAYIPCLSAELMDYLEAPGSYLMGMCKANLSQQLLDRIDQLQIILVDVDNDKVYNTTNVIQLPRSVQEQLLHNLQSVYRPIAHLYGNVSARAVCYEQNPSLLYTENAVRFIINSFFSSFQQMMSNVSKFLIKTQDKPQTMVFLHKSFLQNQTDHEFWENFISSQTFASYVDAYLMHKQTSPQIIYLGHSPNALSEPRVFTYNFNTAHQDDGVHPKEPALVPKDLRQEIKRSFEAGEATPMFTDDELDKIHLMNLIASKIFNFEQIQIHDYIRLRKALGDNSWRSRFRCILSAFVDNEDISVLPTHALVRLSDVILLLIETLEEDEDSTTPEDFFSVVFIVLYFTSHVESEIHSMIQLLYNHPFWAHPDLWSSLFTQQGFQDVVELLIHFQDEMPRPYNFHCLTDGFCEAVHRIQYFMHCLGVSDAVMRQFLFEVSQLNMDAGISDSLHLPRETELPTEFLQIHAPMTDLKKIMQLQESLGIPYDEELLNRFQGQLLEGKKAGAQTKMSLWSSCIGFTSSRYGIKTHEVIKLKAIQSIEYDSRTGSVRMVTGQKIFCLILDSPLQAFSFVRRAWLLHNTQTTRRRLHNTTIASLSSNSMVLHEEDIRYLLESSSYCKYEDSDMILANASSSSSLFYISSGSVKVEKGSNDLGKLVAGELFGELGFMQLKDISLTYKADENGTIVYEWTSSMLDRIIQEVPALGGRLFASVALQLTTIFQTLKSLRNMSISTSGNTISPERNRSSSLSKRDERSSSVRGRRSTGASVQKEEKSYSCTLMEKASLNGTFTITEDALQFQAHVLNVNCKETYLLQDCDDITMESQTITLVIKEKKVVLANLYNPEDAFSEITLKWKRIRAAVVASVTLGIPTDRAPSSPKVSDLLEYGSGLHTLSVPAVLVDSDFRTFLDGLSHTVYEKDECLVNEGDTDRTIFQIIKGRVRIEVKNPLDGHFVTSRILGEGAIFGEMTFVSGGPRIASVRADDELVSTIQAASRL
eukprot:TRINITY_DN3584_c0_g1_i11.p1 TRINITY_DN3584_c0_g1~~TRINITY_DN3584_c0_g1_i11.p1  ORF type:complete len:1237 (+),score=196.12 TRINITY_DN3584_c0_g1_i11:62-3772(+)